MITTADNMLNTSCLAFNILTFLDSEIVKKITILQNEISKKIDPNNEFLWKTPSNTLHISIPPLISLRNNNLDKVSICNQNKDYWLNKFKNLNINSFDIIFTKVKFMKNAIILLSEDNYISKLRAQFDENLAKNMNITLSSTPFVRQYFLYT